MSSKNNRDNIVWVDMEMTGLNPEENHILEIACIITDKHLNSVSNLYHSVIHQPQSILDGMNDWCKEHHAKSGLITECRKSTTSIQQVEVSLLEFLKQYTPAGTCPLAGNTIYMDRIFLMKYLPEVNNHLHYRVIDVSSINELVRRWYPSYNGFQKSQNHRAVTDVKGSIAELKYLREKFFLSRK